jgi:predicted O-methyltransferase YrrM
MYMSLFELEKITIEGNGDSDQHVLPIYSIAVASKAMRILELGVRDGSTTLPLLMAAVKNGGELTSVDINETNFKPQEKWRPHWKFVKMNALEFLKQQKPTKPYDLIFIDDWHAYEHVRDELAEIDRLVSPRSIVLMHDLMYGNTPPCYHSDLTQHTGQWANGGPYRAVAELPSQFWEFATLPYNNGLTILRKKYSNRYFS